MTSAGAGITVIAVDGPAASGKGTIARRLAAHFGFAHLDTGLLYRAVGAIRRDAVAAEGGAVDDPAAAEAAARGLSPVDLTRTDLRTAGAGECASQVAAIPGVRTALLAFQRRFAAEPPEGAPGAVLDGRDIGTVICPDATAKLFVTASAEERARRRCDELVRSGEAADYETVLAAIRARDARDASREDAPMAAAADADLLDTTNLAIEPAVAKAIDLIMARAPLLTGR